MTRRLTAPLVCVASVLVAASPMRADDWPEFRGKGRLGVWHETGILEEFPADGLKAIWRTPIKAGFVRLPFLGPQDTTGRLVERGGARQLIVWNPEEVVSLDPENGEFYWRQPYTNQADYE